MVDSQGLKGLEEIKPYLRSLVAFIAYLRFHKRVMQPFESAYDVADRFIDQLESDLNGKTDLKTAK